MMQKRNTILGFAIPGNFLFTTTLLSSLKKHYTINFATFGKFF